ncbi:PREDICTED: natural killer cells antigen CD94 [Galeopterus variegatus]|uniref:Natural killer cells antigen CD94 n=1 Tax=Galeopterus variegatus TaxID=482537 RepID=A0ABM0RR36_GALVR|nr:PREDICTED: natural killer cells antigen CD94 [Galeopterus variegatus]
MTPSKAQQTFPGIGERPRQLLLQVKPLAQLHDPTPFLLNKHTLFLLCTDLGTSFLMAELQLLRSFLKSPSYTCFSAASRTTVWKLISGTLGIICLSLMATLGILLKNLLTPASFQSTSSPEPITQLQNGSDCCSCQEKWIGYQCNCYFISSEIKTWEESRHFCASQNSSLLQLQKRNELQFFMNSSQNFYWIGLSYSKEYKAWLWEDGSAPSLDLFLSPQTLNPENCIQYSPSNNVWDGPCGSRSYYICKQKSLQL